MTRLDRCVNQSRCCSYLAQNYTLIHVFLFQRLIIVSLFLNLSKILRARLKSHFQEKISIHPNVSSYKWRKEILGSFVSLDCAAAVGAREVSLPVIYPAIVFCVSRERHISCRILFPHRLRGTREECAGCQQTGGGRGEEVADDRIDRRPASLVRSHPRAHLLTSWPRR